MANRKSINQSSSSRRRSAWDEGPWNEIAGIVLFGIGLVIMLALVSYSPDDPSWNSTGAYEHARNWIGPVGAKIADLLYQMLGLAALFVPATLFMAGWWQWQEERTQVSKPKTLGIILMIIAITGVLTMIGSDHPRAYYLGGFIGRWLVYSKGIGLVHLVGTMGAIVSLLIIFIAGLVIGTDFSIVGSIVRRDQSEQEPGMFSFLGDRYRAWRQERSTIRGQRETAEQLKEKLQQRNRQPTITRPVINQRELPNPKTRAITAGENPASHKVSRRVHVPEDEFQNLDDFDNEPLDEQLPNPLPPAGSVSSVGTPRSKSSPVNGSPS
ncbi:MAG: DNA translocase FtsK 4TM domain-containing protein, partial [Acidobacteria bacterium]|nr:DNA translocase FtsK 4TM domain-containing protein [Acidobacteriota bacterium]